MDCVERVSKSPDYCISFDWPRVRNCFWYWHWHRRRCLDPHNSTTIPRCHPHPCVTSVVYENMFPPPIQSPTYSHYSVYTPTTSPTTYFPPAQQSPIAYPFQQSFPLPLQPQPQQVHHSPYAHIPHTHSNLATLPIMSGYEDDGGSNHGGPSGSGNPAKRAIEEQERKGSLDDGGSSKKKRISLSCAQCKSTS